MVSPRIAEWTRLRGPVIAGMRSIRVATYLLKMSAMLATVILIASGFKSGAEWELTSSGTMTLSINIWMRC